MAVVLTCPFCNAVVPSPEGTERVTCGRCGESFATAGRGDSSGAGTNSPQGDSVQRRSTGMAPYLVGGLLALGLAAGAMYYLGVFPRSSKTPPGSNASRSVVKPAELSGLGYIPESCEAVIAIQWTAYLEKMGPDAERDPVEALTRMGFPRPFVDAIESASGVGLKNVDQMVVGTSFEKGSFPPQLFVVVHTREPYDIDALVRRRKGTSLKHDSRTLHAVKAEGTMEVFLWSPSNRVLVGALLKRDFESIPLEPRAGSAHLKPEIARLMSERVAPDASFWLVAASDQWGKYMRPYTWLPGSMWNGRDDLIGPAERLRNLSISVSQDAERRVEIRIDCKNAAGAAQLREAYRQRFGGEDIAVGGEGEVVTLETEFDAKRVGSMISRLIGEKK